MMGGEASSQAFLEKRTCTYVGVRYDGVEVLSIIFVASMSAIWEFVLSVQSGDVGCTPVAKSLGTHSRR